MAEEEKKSEISDQDKNKKEEVFSLGGDKDQEGFETMDGEAPDYQNSLENYDGDLDSGAGDHKRKIPEKIDFFSPETILAFSFALVGDIIFFIPPISWLCSLFLAFIFYPKIKGFLTKIVFITLLILPLPVHILAIIWGILMTNAIIRFIVNQITIIAIGALTFGAGAVVGEGAAVATEVGAEVATQVGTQAAKQGAQMIAKEAIKGAGKQTAKKAGEKVAKSGTKRVLEKAKSYALKKTKEKLEEENKEIAEEKGINPNLYDKISKITSSKFGGGGPIESEDNMADEVVDLSSRDKDVDIDENKEV